MRRPGMIESKGVLKVGLQCRPSNAAESGNLTLPLHPLLATMHRHMTAHLAIVLLNVCDALTFGARATFEPRALVARSDFASFERSFNDQLYEDERLEKNRANRGVEAALPQLGNGFRADALAIREGIDEAREAGATVVELKPYIEVLRKADPSLLNETDEAILTGAELAAQASLPQPAKPPRDSYLTAEQFEALRQASMSAEASWDVSLQGECPDAIKSKFSGRPIIFFSLLRNPRTDPAPVMWQAVRSKWPILQDIPDEELQKNLVACRMEFVDARFI